MEKDTKNQNQTSYIYEILGISSATVDEKNDHSNSEKPKDHHDMVEDPTGFDVLWKHFRLCMILGIIATVLPFIIWGIASINFSSWFSGSNGNDVDFIDEVAAVEEVVEDQVSQYSTYTDNSISVDESEVIEEDYAVEDEEPAEIFDTYFFEGTINDKYPIHLCLDISDFGGKYYYDKSGVSNCMFLNITNMDRIGDSYSIEMEEYNDSGDLCGKWTGILTSQGEFSGFGEFLGKTMPFSLTSCSASETDF